MTLLNIIIYGYYLLLVHFLWSERKRLILPNLYKILIYVLLVTRSIFAINLAIPEKLYDKLHYPSYDRR